MPTTVLWNPAPLNAAVKSAFRSAAFATARAIEANKPEHRIPVKGPFFMDQGNRAIIRTGGLAPVFEKGARAHDIFPKGAKVSRKSRSKGQVVFKVRAVRGATTRVLRLADGGFAAYVRHPGMAARPFIRPQVLFFRARFNLAARARLTSAAFRRAA